MTSDVSMQTVVGYLWEFAEWSAFICKHAPIKGNFSCQRAFAPYVQILSEIDTCIIMEKPFCMAVVIKI